MPQVEYWGDSFTCCGNECSTCDNGGSVADGSGFTGSGAGSAGSADDSDGCAYGTDGVANADGDILRALDMMTLKVTPPAEKPDSSLRPSLLPQGAEAYGGRPALEAYRGGRPVFVRWTSVSCETNADRTAITIVSRDEVNAIELTITLEIAPGGLVIVRQKIVNIGSGETAPLVVNWLESTLPVPKRANRLTQFTGRWALEKQPSTTPMPVGATTRECWHGKTGHESPWLFILSDGEPQWSDGDVWAVHLAWSGNQRYRLDNLPHYEPLLGAGELLGPAEVRLVPGESYETPQVCFSHSSRGLDGMAARFHRWLRSLPGHVNSERPVTLNTWEAVYFDHDEATLTRLADVAAAVGVERFVLDDGWFHERRDDSRGLGDWVVDPDVWPNGLDGLAAHVHDLGMQFGLWFEPEMINLDSDLAREHPDWILAAPEAVPYRGDVSYRNQYVLDLGRPEAYAHVRGQMAALIRELGIDYIKWDHNRDVTEPVSGVDGGYGLHRQTEACYRLFDDLKAEFPTLEIESCSSGGARTDAGILQHADRIWASDSNDPRDRVDIQRFTELVVPPEMIGAHVGPSPAHSTGLATDLSYRCAISLTGCPGFEWNLLELGSDELEQVRGFVGLVKELRGLLHSGTVHHSDFHDPMLRGRGVVSADGLHAVWTVASVGNPANVLAERLRLPVMCANTDNCGTGRDGTAEGAETAVNAADGRGRDGAGSGIDPNRWYHVKLREEAGAAKMFWNTPAWIGAARTADGFRVPGFLLAEVGLQLPQLWPLQAMTLEFVAE
ncbi:alpha-galactosidase [Bifidobacterium sp. BRDM6]|uniref:alpha-galactosidase n=2 Tax=Bifidobacterium choloepi TaxID=2614131 RepID=A0A6I5N2K6_9BIFI|nr:alpha-galactosidase [Bifidobacterium choloepi]